MKFLWSIVLMIIVATPAVAGNQGYIFGGPVKENDEEHQQLIEQALDEQSPVIQQEHQDIQDQGSKTEESVNREKKQTVNVWQGIKRVDEWIQKNAW